MPDGTAYTPTMHRLRVLAALCALVPLTAPAQDWAKVRLDASPRHREYVTISEARAAAEQPVRKLQAFVVYPEVKVKAPVIVLVYEIFGLSDWVKNQADEFAAQGYIVVVPDLVTGLGPNGGNSDAFTSQDAIVKAVTSLDAAQVTTDLEAAADYGKHLPAASGKLFVAGFCWGGGKTFAFANHRHDLAAAFVFYGSGPADVSGITAPVYGFYAGNDARIGATLPATTEAMKAAGKKFDPVTYDGAGHGFMRAGEAPDATPGNKAAREQALVKMLSILKSSGSQAAAKPIHGPHATKASAAASAEAFCHDAMPATVASN